ncbi:MAG: hypothetical protein OXN24_05495 [Candidatus Dadabacteria bacterium]|nr:hypothetical protein [Candidatus Dadabacteria bacterium]
MKGFRSSHPPFQDLAWRNLGLRVQAHYGRNAERTAPLPTSEAILLWH